MSTKIKIDPEKHYSLNELVELNLFPVLPTTTNYLRFIGKQALLGNPLNRDFTAKRRQNNAYPIKGSSIIEFLKRM